MEVKDYILNIPNAERRFAIGGLEVRNAKKDDETEDENIKIIRGYAALFSVETDLGYYREVIEPGFFDDVLKNDCRCLFNHDVNFVLGRGDNSGKDQTLTYGVDKKGLWYECILDMRITTHSDIYKSIQRGDITQSSFAFITKETAWVSAPIGEPSLRKLVKAKALYDTSPVTYPAYADTSIGARSLAELVAQTSDEMSYYEARMRTLSKQINK